MERIGRIYRSTLEKEFKKRLADTNSLFIVRYAGVKSSELTKLRNNLSQNNGKLFIAKNSLANRVLKEVDMKGLVDLLGGQTAFVFGYDDPIAICKIISAFIKEHKALEFQGGILEQKMVGQDELAYLASMPSVEELRAKFVSCIKAPITNLVFGLSALVKKPIYVLNAIKEKKEKEKQ